jgi:hypothetical protein
LLNSFCHEIYLIKHHMVFLVIHFPKEFE